MLFSKILKASFGVFLFVFSFSFNLYSQESSQESSSGDGGASYIGLKSNNIDEPLIDFTSFEDRLKSSQLFAENSEIRKKNLKDLSESDIDPETLQPNYQLTVEDMLYKNWAVNLNSSAQTVQTSKLSYAKRVKLLSSGEKEGNYALGVRIHFPKTPFKAFAEVMPPFEIPTYTKEGKVISAVESGKYMGIVNNVGKIKNIKIKIGGRNFKNGIAIRLKDHFDNIHEYFMGYSYFSNWRNLIWKNPSYIASIDTMDLYRVPLYPREVPYVKFYSLVVYRPPGEFGGDVIHYFKQINITFDYAIQPQSLSDFDINDEENWGILSERAAQSLEKRRKMYANKLELLRNAVIRKGENYIERGGKAPDVKSAGGQESSQPQQEPVAP